METDKLISFANKIAVSEKPFGFDSINDIQGSAEDFFDKHPMGARVFLWYLMHGLGEIAPSLVTDARIDACAAKEPLRALEYAPQYLTPERLDWCAKEAPTCAIRNAPQYLTPARLDWCAEHNRLYALRVAGKYLSPERLDEYASIFPHHGLNYAALLTPERLDICAAMSPKKAYLVAADYLTPARLAQCEFVAKFVM